MDRQVDRSRQVSPAQPAGCIHASRVFPPRPGVSCFSSRPSPAAGAASPSWALGEAKGKREGEEEAVQQQQQLQQERRWGLRAGEPLGCGRLSRLRCRPLEPSPRAPGWAKWGSLQLDLRPSGGPGPGQDGHGRRLPDRSPGRL